MNVEETIKHLGNHWDLYRFVGNEERSFDAAKRFLMELCEKPESTARATTLPAATASGPGGPIGMCWLWAMPTAAPVWERTSMTASI